MARKSYGGKLVISLIVLLAIALVFYTQFFQRHTVGINCPNNDCSLLGASCGTVSPDARDQCCAERNKDTPHVMCVGNWKYVPETNQCIYYCQ